MTILDRVAARLGYVKKSGQRSYAAAQASRLAFSWATTSTHVNRDLQNDLAALRGRSRDLSRNNDYARRFLSMVKTNVVGHSGFSLQVQALKPDGTIDQRDSDLLEESFWRWGRPGACEVTGRLSFTDVQRLVIETIARDGEVLVREVTRGPFGYQLELIDPQLLDERYNDDLSNGNKVRMGVEVDSWGAPVAYWLRDADASDPQRFSDSLGSRIRVPASEVRHLFLSEMVRQLRGVPWMASAMLRMNMLAGYEEAAVVAARVGAAKLGVIETGDGEVDGLGTDTDDRGIPQLDSREPGEFLALPAGSKLGAWDPDYPHEQYGAFVKACLRGISSGLGVAYNGLANDLEGVNYSSIRAGVLEEREVWKAIQGWMIDAFLAPTYSRWLERAILAGAVPLPMSKFAKFDAALWQGRRWDWVDPHSDTQANVLAIEKGLKSPSQVIREMGRDPEEVWRESAKDRARLREVGILAAQSDPPPTAPVRSVPTDRASEKMQAITEGLRCLQESISQVNDSVSSRCLALAESVAHLGTSTGSVAARVGALESSAERTFAAAMQSRVDAEEGRLAIVSLKSAILQIGDSVDLLRKSSITSTKSSGPCGDAPATAGSRKSSAGSASPAAPPAPAAATAPADTAISPAADTESLLPASEPEEAPETPCGDATAIAEPSPK